MRLQHIALSVLLAASAAAADGATVSDLRLGFYGMGTSGSSDYELTNTTTGALVSSSTETWDADSHGRFSVSYVGGEAKPVGMIFGIGAAIDVAEYEWANGDSQSWTGFIIDLNLGLAVALDEKIHFEAAGVFGFGSGMVDYEVAGFDIDPADAAIVELGLRFGAYGTFSGLQVGIETGWMATYYLGAEWEVVGMNRTLTEDTEFSGAFIGLTIGARL